MANLLIVSDQCPELEDTQAVLSGQSNISLYSLAANQDGPDFLESTPVDLVMMDVDGLGLGLDGLQLLAYMTISSPIPTIVMSRYESLVTIRRLTNMGTGLIRFVKLPIDSSGLLDVIVANLPERLGNASLTNPIPLHCLLHLIDMENLTCTLNVEAEGNGGLLGFDRGELRGAVCGQLSGQDAVTRMLSWSHPRVSLSTEYDSDYLAQEVEHDVMNLVLSWATARQRSTVSILPEAIKTSAQTVTKIDDPAPLLHQVLATPGVSAVVLVATDGIVIDSAGSLSTIDMEMIGSLTALTLNGAHQALDELGFGEFRAFTLEADMEHTANNTMISCWLAGEVLVMVVAADTRKLGLIRKEVKQLLPELKSIF